MIRHFFNILFIISLTVTYLKPLLLEGVDISISNLEKKDTEKDSLDNIDSIKKYISTHNLYQNPLPYDIKSKITFIIFSHKKFQNLYIKDIPTPPPDFI